ncbi:MAG TPA: hypothetical protein VGF55_02200 [Gemmataceae bacterium]|jgi:hypothetical protein
MSKAWIGAAAVVVVGALVLRAQEPKPAPPAKNGGEFAGKLVYVQSRAGVKEVLLEKAEVRPLGGRPFLVGKSVTDDALSFRPFVTGAEVWVPVDEVESLAVYDGLAQFRRSQSR